MTLALWLAFSHVGSSVACWGLLTLNRLLFEEVLRRDLYALDRRQSTHSLRKILQDNFAVKIGILFEKLLALVTVATTNVHKERFLRALRDLPGRLIEHIQAFEPIRVLNCRHGNLKGVEVLRVLLEPVETTELGAVSFLERSLGVR